VLSHLDLKPLEIVTPSLRSWNLTGWDWIATIEKYLLVQSSICAFRNRKEEDWDYSNVNFETLLAKCGPEWMIVWEPFLWKKMKTFCLLFDCIRIVITVLSLKPKMLETTGVGELGACGMLPCESDTGTRESDRVKCSLVTRTAIESVCRKLKLETEGIVSARSRASSICCFFKTAVAKSCF